MNRPHILITAYGEAVITFPFHRALVEAIKVEVPSWARSYNPVTKAWIVRHPYIARARELVEEVFCFVEVDDQSWTPKREPRPKTSYTILHLLPSAPPELVESAYKCLARINHPDRGGDTTTMQELNAAVEEIRRQTA